MHLSETTGTGISNGRDNIINYEEVQCNPHVKRLNVNLRFDLNGVFLKSVIAKIVHLSEIT